MNWKTRFLGAILALCMVMGLIPGVVAQEIPGEEDGNGQTQAAGDWEYTPETNLMAMANSFADSSASTGSTADIVKVHVTAKDRTSGETVSVPGASVNLYVKGKRIRTTDSDENGDAEISLAGLSLVERRNATISADKVVSRGTAIDGGDRDKLFRNFPKDGDGDYYRYTLELHSETLDSNGNWCGAAIPTSYETNKVDMAFVIDATGSMGNEINNVKTNIAAFAENLLAGGLDIRFSILEYRDIAKGEETVVHTLSGSHWMTDIASVTSTLESIEARGGGDTKETVMDALGYVADNGKMSWRSDAYRFAFVLTDAGYKTDNNYGYTSMEELIKVLADMKVVTSVITSTSQRSEYAGLYQGTGGIFADINSVSFDAEMMDLSDSVIETVTRELTLNLSEPRMLVNLSVCYYADDQTSQSAQYRQSVKNMLNEYANRLAETTDGHVLLDQVLLLSTDNRLDFYDTDRMASMADIRIETEENDDGTLWFNVTIHSNANVAGFFNDGTYVARYQGQEKENFSHLKDGDKLDGRRSFYRIQLSGLEGANWNNSMIDDAYAYSTTVAHETGHYLMGFFDEYLNANGDNWRDVGGKPYSAFGLMDNQHDDIEMSKDSVDYYYTGGSFHNLIHSAHTRQTYLNGMSCESFLAELLTDVDFPDPTGSVGLTDYQWGPYEATYTKASGQDRKATYSYAGLTDSDFIDISDSGSRHTTRSLFGASASEASLTQQTLAGVSWISHAEAVEVTLTEEKGACTVSYRKSGGADFIPAELTDGTAVLPIAKGEMAEVRVCVDDGISARYNCYYLDRSGETDTGYFYRSADNTVQAYVTTEAESSYTWVGDNTAYTNGDYVSVNQATWIGSDNGIGFVSGEIYSVASYLADIDYTTLCWFRYADGDWTRLDTDYSEEETMNIGARADLAGEGLYVLMAKKAPAGGAEAAQDLSFRPSTQEDGVVTLCFTDPNTGSKYYHVYYSEEPFTDKNADGVTVKSFYAGSTDLRLNLISRDRTVYAAVEIVLEDGTRSALSEAIPLVAGEADSDGDGIPDWYCDQYALWPKDGEDKEIASSDDDGDGLTNLEEYLGGSDPTDPNDPEHTTNVPVESVTVSPAEVELSVGSTAEVRAVVLPENATNQTVMWSTDDSGIVSVEAAEGICRITGRKEGTTKVYAVTSDGGFSAAVTVEVATHKGGTATCHSKAVCEICGKTYGQLDPANHDGGTEIRDAKEATYTEEGYTGDTYCLGCGAKIAEGTVIPRKTASGGGSGVSTYAITNTTGEENGSVRLDKTRAPAGSTVTITVKPDAGYRLEQLTVTDSKENTIKVTQKEAGVYTFPMPASQVWVQAVFLPSADTLPFTDVPEGAWYEDAVAYVYGKGLMSGTGEAAFSPGMAATRSMIVTILYRLDGSPAVSGSGNFTDVEAGHWSEDAVAWAVSHHIVSGYGNGLFGPNDNITREQLVTLLFRYAQYKGYDTPSNGDLGMFTDGEEASGWAEEALLWAVGRGILTGKGNGILDPTGTATRAEVAQMLMKDLLGNPFPVS